MPVPRVILDCLLAEFPDNKPQHVEGLISLLEDDATVPFIARYRKERTGSMDEVRVREIRDRARYLTELESRREAILKSIRSRDLLTPEIEEKIRNAPTKAELEDHYLPFKPKKKTRAVMAKERGLLPLARAIQSGELVMPLEDLAAPFIHPDRALPGPAEAIAGARDILAEEVAEAPEIRGLARARMLEHGELTATVVEARRKARSKYEAYYDFREAVKAVPSHRYLAVRRGEKESFLRLDIELDATTIVAALESRLLPRDPHPYKDVLVEAAADAWQRIIQPSIRAEILTELKKRSDQEAIRVFARNLRDLLLAPPAGASRVLGVDPGQRSGCKLVVLDQTGQFLEEATVYPHPPQNKHEEAAEKLRELVCKHEVELVAIGNGTASRETDSFVRDAISANADIQVTRVVVNEAGASVYSASKVGREEFPSLDVTVRGAISIGRRLQDPLAELVKIEPRSIGVGQYQHDVHQGELRRCLADVVESCVNHVGVDLNTASASLLAHVAGVGPGLARSIVGHRDKTGPFKDRQDLMAVQRFGAKAFEQATGFLRIPGGTQPLDATAVHPERYELVSRIAETCGCEVAELVGAPERLSSLTPEEFVAEDVGLPTIKDIIEELGRPGRDPRDAFEVPQYRDDVTEIGDLQEGMSLEGRVTNVAKFGVFVDLGVHQDGLIHISEISRSFIRDPGESVKVGQTVKVKVLAVDADRRRISLSMKALQPARRKRRKRVERGGKPDGAQGAAKTRPAGEKKRRRPRKGRNGEGKPTAPPAKPEPKLPEEELYRIKLEELRKKFGG
jgi:protein Tex